MKIDILCSDPNHPVYPFLLEWKGRREARHQVRLLQRKAELSEGEILFLISCHEIIGPEVRNNYRSSLVIHASDLPRGRGWSPHIWQIFEGRREIPVTLLEAEDAVDSGAILAHTTFHLEGHELADEINALLFRAELELMDFAVDQFGFLAPRPQDIREPTYTYRRRTPDDSRIDPDKTLAEQFDLLRVADPRRFPAYFDLHGYRYYISITKRPPHAGD